MIRTRLGLLGLCAMLLGLMAFSASAAHAEENAHWWIVEKEGAALKELEAEVNLEIDSTHLTLHTIIAGVKVLFLCLGISAVKIKLQAKGVVGSGGKVKFSTCTTELNGAVSSACEPVNGTEKGVILTNAGHGLIVLHKLEPSGVKDDIVELLPDTGTTLATVVMGAECSIGTKVPIIGKLTLKDCQGLFLKHLVKHLIEEGPLTELWAISKTEEHKASILGSAWVFLIGVHEKMLFSGETA